MSKGVRWWCGALLVHVGALAVAADQSIWILLRDKTDAEGRRIAWVDLGAGHTDAELDLPVSPRYIERLREMGVAVRFSSRWLNAVSAQVSPEVQRRVRRLRILSLQFGPCSACRGPVHCRRCRLPAPNCCKAVMDLAFEQLAQIAIPPLHDQGLTGAGVRVALLDNGFHYAEHAAFASIRVVAQRDFVNDDEIVSRRGRSTRHGRRKERQPKLARCASTFLAGRLSTRSLCRRGTRR